MHLHKVLHGDIIDAGIGLLRIAIGGETLGDTHTGAVEFTSEKDPGDFSWGFHRALTL